MPPIPCVTENAIVSSVVLGQMGQRWSLNSIWMKLRYTFIVAEFVRSKVLSSNASKSGRLNCFGVDCQMAEAKSLNCTKINILNFRFQI
jgi:hypothetical protein